MKHFLYLALEDVLRMYPSLVWVEIRFIKPTGEVKVSVPKEFLGFLGSGLWFMVRGKALRTTSWDLEEILENLLEVEGKEELISLPVGVPVYFWEGNLFWVVCSSGYLTFSSKWIVRVPVSWMGEMRVDVIGPIKDQGVVRDLYRIFLTRVRRPVKI